MLEMEDLKINFKHPTVIGAIIGAITTALFALITTLITNQNRINVANLQIESEQKIHQTQIANEQYIAQQQRELANNIKPSYLEENLQPENTFESFGAVKIIDVFGVGYLSEERIMIVADEGAQTNINKWTISSGNKLYSYIFPNLTLFEGGAVELYTKKGDDTVVSLYWGRNGPMWQSGDEIILADNNGVTRSIYIVP